MATPTLIELLIEAPSCHKQATVSDVMDLFRRSGFDQLILCNSEQYPVGLLSFARLFSCLGLDPIANHSLSQAPVCLAYADIVEPITVFPKTQLERPLAIFLVELKRRSNTCKHWACVDSDHKYIGILDPGCYLASLVADLPLPLENASRGEDVHLNQFLQANVGDQFADLQTEQSILEIAVNVLESLPLPLMLQTNTGKVLTQNLAWRKHLGELEDPIWVQQSASVLLGTSNENRDRTAFDWRESDPNSKRYSLESLDLDDAPELSSFCQTGQDTSTCICVCPMKDGRRHVLQFATVPVSQSRQISEQGESPFSNFRTLKPFQLGRLTSVEASSSFPHQMVDSVHMFHAEELWLVIAQDTTEPPQLGQDSRTHGKDSTPNPLQSLQIEDDNFLSFLSHELKTPLTSIQGLSQLLIDPRLGVLSDRQAQYVDLIHRNTRRLTRTLNQISDLTRLETGHIDFSPQSVETKNICQRALADAVKSVNPRSVGSENRFRIEASGDRRIQDFKLEIEAGLETLWIDELHFCQMLSHLLSNAFRLTTPDDSVGLKVEHWGQWLAFTVWDTGVGIPIDQQHILLQRFQKLDNPLLQGSEGIELGLVLAQRLAYLQGGDLTFVCDSEHGNKFTVLLPHLCPPKRSNISLLDLKDKQSDLSIQRYPETSLVLIAASMTSSVQRLREQLLDLGCKVAIARSGPEALDKVVQLHPEGVFISPDLPFRSGFDVLDCLKTDPKTKSIPIALIIESNHQSPVSMQNLANSILEVPATREQLQDAVRQFTKTVSINSAQNSDFQRSESKGLLSGFTVLHLNGENQGSAEPTPLTAELHRLLETYQCRVLEVNDLDQASLLSRVWQPDVMILDPDIQAPCSYLRYLARKDEITSIPLITLTQEATRAANQMPGLLVFPCLAPLDIEASERSEREQSSTLLQVIRVAAERSGRD